MAEIRCPMCSRLNPEELDVCQYCQARLKPLIANQPPQDSPAGSTENAVPNSEEDIPEWLRALRDRKREEDPALEPPATTPVEPDLGEWDLSGLLPAEPAAEPAEEDSDWLERIRQRNREEDPTPEPSAEPEFKWNPDDFAPPEPPLETPAPAEPEDQNVTAEPDWLDRLRTGPLDPARLVERRPAPQPPVEETPPAWNPALVEGLESEPPATPSYETVDELPDWLKKLVNHAAETPAGEESSPASNAEALTPAESELKDFSMDWPAEAPAAPSEPDAGEVAWPLAAEVNLSEEPSETPAQPSGEETALLSEPAANAVEFPMPDWDLAAFSPVSPEPHAVLDEGAPAEPPEAAQETPAAEPPAAPVEPFNLDEWAAQQSEPVLSETAPGEAILLPEEPASQDFPFAAEALPHLDSGEPLPAGEDGQPAATPEDDLNITQPAIAWQDGVLPDWLASIQADSDAIAEPVAASGAEESAPASGEELPDWLIGLGAAASQDDHPADEPPVAVDESAAEGLQPAELPNWVQAMRPIESIAPEPSAPLSEEEPTAENSGPLAGLPGVLPVQPLGTRVQKPSGYSVELKVSETQAGYAQILESVISGEGAVRSRDVKPRVGKPHYLVQAIIAVILLVSILYPFVSGVGMMPVPNLYPQEVLNLRSAIMDLPKDGTVLVVADYEPALAGEIEASAAGVMDHLMVQSARMSVVSSQPTGTALAENLFKKVWQQPQAYYADYQNGQKLAYLGYLAGGPGGMLSFAQQPQASVPALLPDGSTAWDQPALQGVQTLADFDLVLVLTDSAETGRAWVEQVKPYLGDTPLLFVSSAQAAPVLSPYLDSQQIYGMVSGLSGGAAYEQIMQRVGLGSLYWNGYQTGLMVIIAIILIGGVANAIAGVVKPTRNEDEA